MGLGMGIGIIIGIPGAQYIPGIIPAGCTGGAPGIRGRAGTGVCGRACAVWTGGCTA